MLEVVESDQLAFETCPYLNQAVVQSKYLVLRPALLQESLTTSYRSVYPARR